MQIDSDKLLEWADKNVCNDFYNQLWDAIHSGQLAAKRECVLDGLSDEDADIVRNAIKNEALRLRKQIEAENNGCPNFCTGGIIYQGRHSYPCPNCTAA